MSLGNDDAVRGIGILAGGVDADGVTGKADNALADNPGWF
jgi:hypothetical protein